ncbi:MAG: pentapeptide repeat-containing protein [Streptosporangiaceae bacterium]
MRPRYRALRRRLAGSNLIRVDLGFDEIESLIATPLPAIARESEEWWTTRSRRWIPSRANTWQRAGYEVSTLSLDRGFVRFRKIPETRAISRTPVTLAAVAVAVILADIAVLWFVPALLIDPLNVVGTARANAENNARTALIGLLVALGAAGSLVYTARTYALGRESQVTDRFTKAVEQLGNASLGVRLGGLYALSRIAKDSPRDAPAVVSVMCQYARMEGRRWAPPQQVLGSFRWRLYLRRLKGSVDPASGVTGIDTRADIQVAVREAALLSQQLPPLSLQLTGIRLDGAYLWGIVAHEAALDGSSMRRAVLSGADLRQSWIRYAQLEGSWFVESKLQGTVFSYSRLEGADFRRSHLEGAMFYRTNLTGVNFEGAYPAGADLRKARGLTERQLKKAVLDSETRLPRYAKRAKRRKLKTR